MIGKNNGFVLYFFFSSRRRHTRFDCDWSSDVCSSDLFYGGTKMSVGEVLARVRELSMPQGTQPEQTAGASTSQGTPQTHCAPARPAIPLVELTGGEPLLQPDVYPLADKLLAAGYTVLIEHSGERYVGN